MVEANVQGLSLWMYRVVRDEERLNDPQVCVGTGQFQSPPLPLRLHYLVTPVVNGATAAARDAQLIPGKVLQILNDRTSSRDRFGMT